MPNNKPGSRLIRAAGAVAWRPGRDGEPQVLLVHRKKYDDWSLPKGKTEPGEPLPVTAVREVLEEGGARLALGRRLVSVRYNVGGRPKRVHYWAARVLSVDERAVPNSEVDEVTWMPAARAIEKVSYAHDHGVLADFAARRAHTVPLILLRHSKALAKGNWRRLDVTRPLDGSGRSDAKALADLLACFASRPRLISSAATRCTETLGPLSQLTGEQVRVEPSLYIHEKSPVGYGTDAAALIREAIASGEPTVICAHRENLPALQEAALTALAGHFADDNAAVWSGDAIAELPKEWDDSLPTSGFWVLNVAPLPPEPDPADPDPADPDPADTDPADTDPADTDPAEPMQSDPVPPATSRRWWRRLLRLQARNVPAGRQPASDGPGGGEAAGHGAGGRGHAGELDGDDPPAGDAGRDSAEGLVGVLVSADRYDLSEV